MKTKTLALFLSAVLACSLFTACGGREKKDLSTAKSLSDLSGAVIGAQTGTFHLEAVDQIDGVVKKDYPDFTDLLNALQSGAIDGYVAEDRRGVQEGLRHGGDCKRHSQRCHKRNKTDPDAADGGDRSRPGYRL